MLYLVLVIAFANIRNLRVGQNAFIFAGGILDIGGDFDCIRYLLWRWFLARGMLPSCMYYEWHVIPLNCMVRR